MHSSVVMRSVLRLGSTALMFSSIGCFSTARLPKIDAPLARPTPTTFPHQVLDDALAGLVDSEGRVDYKSLRQDQGALLRYLNAVARFSPKSHPGLFPGETDVLTYWINSYNAYVIYAVVTNPKLQSVHDNKAKFFYFTKYVFGGKAHSLYAVENNIIREEFKEPRIHFALNCASVGCPKLPPEAFDPLRLETQLARETKTFCADPTKVQIRDGSVFVSQIFEWYAKDFSEEGGAIAFCRKWGRDDLPTDAQLRYLPYDWSLNAQP
ncbi:MAG: DUF547 domain-containing protein [Myxococcales bacterium]|nr:DUF547 domain-containing protein [Myxococcales bacterium]